MRNRKANYIPSNPKQASRIHLASDHPPTIPKIGKTMPGTHVAALAKAIRLGCCDDEERVSMSRIIGDVCAQFNRNFKRTHFLGACLYHPDDFETPTFEEP